MIYRPHDCGCGDERGNCHQPHCCIPICCQPFCPSPVTPPTPQPVTTPSVLTAANNIEQTVAAGSNLPFMLNTVLYGSDITHTAGTSTITIVTPGVYYVSFHAVVSPPEGTLLSDPVELQLTLNGVPVPGAVSAQTFSASDEVATLSFSTALTVTTAPATLSINAAGISITVEDSALTVVRLGSIPQA